MSQQAYIPVTPATLGATVYSPPLTALYVGSSGSLQVRGLHDANPVTFTNVPVGWFGAGQGGLPYPVSEVITVGSPAGGLIGVQFGS